MALSSLYLSTSKTTNRNNHVNFQKGLMKLVLKSMVLSKNTTYFVSHTIFLTMTFFHCINCLILTYAPLVIFYQASNL